MSEKKKIILAVTGASGSIYAFRLLNHLVNLKDQYAELHLVLSDTAKGIWAHELGTESYNDFNLPQYSKKDFYAPFASGSAGFSHMIICPCSMGTLGRISNGISDDLITRTADVMLKEKKELVLVPRETPYNLIHIQNMEKILLSGAKILPATPSFYSLPKTVDELVDTVVERILMHCGFDFDGFQWGG